jgi:hypothetical protein
MNGDAPAPRRVLRIDPAEIPEWPAAAPARPPRGELATLTLLLGMAGVLFAGIVLGPLALAVGAVALLRPRSPGQTRRIAAGMACALLGLVLWAALVIHWWRSAEDATPDARPVTPSGVQRTGTAGRERDDVPARTALPG